MSKLRQIIAPLLPRWWSLPLVVVIFFAIGTWLLFPTSAVQQRLQAELSLQLKQPVELGTVGVKFPPAIAISTLAITTAPGIPILLSDLRLKPVWRQLLSNTPAINLDARAYQGNISARVDSANNFQLSAHELRWDAPLPQLSALHLNTTLAQLEATGVLNPNNRNYPIKQLEKLKLQLSELHLGGLKQLGLPVSSLNLGVVDIALSQVNQRLTIDNLSSRNGDITIAGKGDITLHRNLARSRINITLNMSLSSNIDPALTSLIQLFAQPQNSGSYSFHIVGTLGQPRLK
jgi:type II secretion system protein N